MLLLFENMTIWPRYFLFSVYKQNIYHGYMFYFILRYNFFVSWLQELGI